jgi:hypothetical protein
MRKHIVRRGECISSIAFESGHFWRVVWDHPDNAELRARRKSGHVLLEGDEVTVPALREKSVDVASGQSHKFRRKGVPEKLRLRFGDDEYPRAGVPYTLTIDGQELRGATDSKGELSHYLAPNARQAELVLQPEGAPEEHYVLELRGLDPVDEVTGLQGRLKNLGFYKGPLDGQLGDATVRAMQDFQASRRLSQTSEPDGATRQALLDAHGG